MRSAVEAAAREANGPEPYGSSPGGGAGGKFRKKPYRRARPATPYDRPPSSSRNLSGLLPSFGEGESNGSDGWLRRIVNPAQRIITAGAHKLFGSVFQKRITRPPSPPPSKPHDTVQEGQQNQQGAANRSSREHLEAALDIPKASYTNEEGSFVNLEKILKQRTFSKSEVDRLTALLHARTSDSTVADEIEKAEVSPSGFRDLKEGSSSIVLRADGNAKHSPVPHVVLSGDVASPAELAKAYMGTRPSKVAPLGFKEDSMLITSSKQTPKLPVMSTVPASSNQRVIRENCYITPRSRGRSAIYGMSRTPYARVHQSTPLKILKPTSKLGDGRSAAPQTPELERIHESCALKRRSSVFENDIGSVGHLRRTRHKPNILSEKRNSLLSSSSAGVRLGSPSTESNKNFTDPSVGNGGIVVPSRNMSSSKSTEIASKILEQLDKLVSPPKEKSSVVKLASSRDKVPLKLSPSDLHGKALKSLDHMDLSKFPEFAEGSRKLDDSVGTSYSGASVLLDIDKVDQRGPSSTHCGFDQLPPSGSRTGETFADGNAMPNHKVVDLEETNRLAAPSAPMKQTFQAFQISAHEDYFDLDDDNQQKESIPTKLVQEGHNGVRTKMKPVFAPETDRKDEPAPVTQAHFLNETKDAGSPFTANSGEKTVTFSFPGIPPTKKKNLEPDVQVASSKPVSERSNSEREANVASSVFTFGMKPRSGDKEKPAAPAFAFASNGLITKDAEKFNGSSTANFASQSSLSGSSSSFSTISVGPVPSVTKVTELNKVGEKKDSIAGDIKTPVAPINITGPSTAGLLKFGVPVWPAVARQQPSLSSAAESIAPLERSISDLPLVASSVAEGSNDKSRLPQTSSAFSAEAPIFKFGSTTTTSGTPTVAPVEDQAKVVMNSEKAVENPFSASSTSSVSNIYGFSSSASNGAFSDKLVSVSFGVSNGSSQVQASTSSSGLSSSTQTIPFQFGSSGPSFSFGLAGNTNSALGSFLFDSPSAIKFSSGTSSGPSLQCPVASSSSSAAANLFGSSQTTAAPVFGNPARSSSSPSTGFSFGATSSTAGSISFGANMTTSSSKSIVGSLGASTLSSGPSTFASNGSSTASSATPIFGAAASTCAPATAFAFGESMANSPSQPVFGNSCPVFSFGQTSAGENNDQMKAEDVMAEDTMPTATPSASLFDQQSVSPAPPHSSLNFAFGSGTNSTFQFGGQPSFTQATNPAPLAATGSSEFNSSGGGSFSLGTGGGDKSGRKIIRVKHRQRRK